MSCCAAQLRTQPLAVAWGRQARRCRSRAATWYYLACSRRAAISLSLLMAERPSISSSRARSRSSSTLRSANGAGRSAVLGSCPALSASPLAAWAPLLAQGNDQLVFAHRGAALDLQLAARSRSSSTLRSSKLRRSGLASCVTPASRRGLGLAAVGGSGRCGQAGAGCPRRPQEALDLTQALAALASTVSTTVSTWRSTARWG